MTISIWTFDWVPPGDKGPRGYVRDLRLRWALEEAGLDYRVETVKFGESDHFARQPFGQVPFMTDGEISLFESGACLLHIAGLSERLMPGDPVGRAETLQWLIAGLNSIEMVSVPWWFLSLKEGRDNGLAGWLKSRLGHLGRVLEQKEWLAAARFTVADLLMADILRLPDVREFAASPVIENYVDRVTSREAFKKALADQHAHFAAADEKRVA